MEQQDDESPESLQACVENFVLPQEMIIEVEGEDAGSLDILPQTRQLYTEQKKQPQSRPSLMKNRPMD